jgi:hypothetical protein
MKMRRIISLGLLAAALIAFPTACEDDEDMGTGTINLSITDAPIDEATVTGVYITIDSMQYHKQNNAWETFEGYNGPRTVNLLNLTDGASELLGNFEMEAGQYNQLRFILDAPERGQGTPSNPGCYLKYENGDSLALFVPSGSQSGFKGTGSFVVPSNGSVDITADFDARKSVVEAGTSGMYILKPTIRLIVDNQAGSITGAVTNIPENSDIIVYAYENDTYESSEADDPGAEGTRFPNAVTSDILDDENNYRLSYLAPMTYDLIVTRYLNGEFMEVLTTVEDVEVTSNSTTSEPIDLSSL